MASSSKTADMREVSCLAAFELEAYAMTKLLESIHKRDFEVLEEKNIHSNSLITGLDSGVK